MQLTTSIPFDSKGFQVRLRLFQSWRLVDRLQVFGHLFTLFPGHVIQAVAHHVDDTELNLGFRKNRLDCLGKTLEAVHAGDEDILHAPVFQLGYHLKPELRAFVLGGPHAKDLLDTVHGYADGKVDGFVNDLAVVPYFHPDGVQIHDGVDIVQEAVLPQLDLFQYRFGNLGDQGG